MPIRPRVKNLSTPGVSLFQNRSIQIGCLLALLFFAAGCSSTGQNTVRQPFQTKLSRFNSAYVEVKSTVANPPERFGEFLVQLESRIIADLRAQNTFKKIYSHAADPDNTAEVGILVIVSGVRNVDNFDRIMWGAMAGQAKTKALVEVRDRKTNELLGSAEIEGASSGGSVVAGTTGQAVDRVADEVVKIVVQNW